MSRDLHEVPQRVLVVRCHRGSCATQPSRANDPVAAYRQSSVANELSTSKRGALAILRSFVSFNVR